MPRGGTTVGLQLLDEFVVLSEDLSWCSPLLSRLFSMSFRDERMVRVAAPGFLVLRSDCTRISVVFFGCQRHGML